MKPILKSVLAATFLLTIGCSKPQVNVSHVSDGFALSQVKMQTTAIWPVAAADMDNTVDDAIKKGWKNKNGFLDEFGSKLSDATKAITGKTIIAPSEVLKAYSSNTDTVQFLDPNKLLLGWDPGNRFTNTQQSPVLLQISNTPLMSGVRFAVIPVRLRLGRSAVTINQAPGVSQPSPVGGPAMMTGGTTSANSFTVLEMRIAILDLSTKKVVWDGEFSTKGGNFSIAMATFDASEGKIRTLVEELVQFYTSAFN